MTDWYQQALADAKAAQAKAGTALQASLDRLEAEQHAARRRVQAAGAAAVIAALAILGWLILR